MSTRVTQVSRSLTFGVSYVTPQVTYLSHTLPADPPPPQAPNQTRPSSSSGTHLQKNVSHSDVLAQKPSVPLTFYARSVPLPATDPPSYVPSEGT